VSIESLEYTHRETANNENTMARRKLIILFITFSLIVSLLCAQESAPSQSEKGAGFVRIDVENVVSFKGHTSGVLCVQFTPDSRKILTSSLDKTIKIWDAQSSEELHSLNGHTEAVWWISLSPDGSRCASASRDKSVKIWDVATTKNILTLLGHTDRVQWVAYSPDGKQLASASFDKTVKLWDAETGRESSRLAVYTSPVTCVAFSHDGARFASSSASGGVKIWERLTGKELFTVPGDYWMLAFNADGGRLAASSTDGKVTLFDSLSGQKIILLRPQNGPHFPSIAFSPDGKYLATGTFPEKTIKIWGVVSGNMIFERKEENAITSIAFSPNGRRLAWTGMGNTVKACDLKFTVER
jgi:WD40 repeat protein